MNKLSIFIICILLGNLIMLLGFILYNGDYSITDHQSNIYSGFLGFIGAIIAVAGTYIVSIKQVKQQYQNDEKLFKKQIRIKNLEELGTILSESRRIVNTIKMELKLNYMLKEDMSEFDFSLLTKDSEDVKELSLIPEKLFNHIYLLIEIGSNKKNSSEEKENFIIQLQDLITDIRLLSIDKKQNLYLKIRNKELIRDDEELDNEIEGKFQEISEIIGEWTFLTKSEIGKMLK